MKYILLLLVVPLLSYSHLKAQNNHDQNDVFLVDSIGTNTICFHTNMSLIDSSFYSPIIENIWRGIDSTGKYIEFTDVEFRVLVFPERTIPRLGMSGVATNDNKYTYCWIQTIQNSMKQLTHIYFKQFRMNIIIPLETEL